MQKSEYANLFANEDRHFYYRATHELLLMLIRRYTKPNAKLSLLDAGCGTGLFGMKLARFGTVMGIDISPQAIQYAKKRAFSATHGSIEQLPFPDGSFDVVTCVDVLYHRRVTHDTQALREFYRVLKPHGMLVLRVPAISWMKTYYDEVVHTRHRYDRMELQKLLVWSGFHIKKLSYVNIVLLPFALISHIRYKLIPSTLSHSATSLLPSVINFLLYALLIIENRMLTFINLPIGLGLVAVVKRE